MNRRGFLAALTGVLAPASLAAAAAPGMTIIRGNVGMGTTIPNAPIHVLPGDQVLGLRTVHDGPGFPSIERMRICAKGSIAEFPDGSVNLAPPSA